MSMHAGVVAFVAASLVAILTSATAHATPTQVNVRIEGKAETLFEGPIWTEGHDVLASSDTQPRPCDATNNHQHATSGPTPTTASVDAMGVLGETFDGQWYGSSFDDYFITRWGPDEQNVAQGAYWGVLVNNVFTSVGGCQYELGAGNEVLWVYNAFQGEALLSLLPVGEDYTSGVRPLIATAHLREPFEVEVLDYADEKEEIPPTSPERTGSSPYQGADVSPVAFTANGIEKVEAKSPATVLTDAQGKASITFTEPGWHRIKATVITEGKEDPARSNRLDICVPAPQESGCGEPPSEDLARTPPSSGEEIKDAEAKHRAEEAGSLPAGPEPPVKTTPELTTNITPLFTTQLMRPGGSSKSPAHAQASPSRSVHMHEDDCWAHLHYRGRWRRMRQLGAWLGTISRGKAGAQVSARLSAGRPVFQLRGTSSAAKVEVLAGSRRKVFTVTRGSSSASRQIVAADRSRAGTVTLRVLQGTVDLDGVALEP